MFTQVHGLLGSVQMYFGEFMKLMKLNVKLVMNIPQNTFEGKNFYLNQKLKEFSKPNMVYWETKYGLSEK